MSNVVKEWLKNLSPDTRRNRERIAGNKEIVGYSQIFIQKIGDDLSAKTLIDTNTIIENLKKTLIDTNTIIENLNKTPAFYKKSEEFKKLMAERIAQYHVQLLQHDSGAEAKADAAAAAATPPATATGASTSLDLSDSGASGASSPLSAGSDSGFTSDSSGSAAGEDANSNVAGTYSGASSESSELDDADKNPPLPPFIFEKVNTERSKKRRGQWKERTAEAATAAAGTSSGASSVSSASSASGSTRSTAAPAAAPAPEAATAAAAAPAAAAMKYKDVRDLLSSICNEKNREPDNMFIDLADNYLGEIDKMKDMESTVTSGDKTKYLELIQSLIMEEIFKNGNLGVRVHPELNKELEALNAKPSQESDELSQASSDSNQKNSSDHKHPGRALSPGQSESSIGIKPDNNAKKIKIDRESKQNMAFQCNSNEIWNALKGAFNEYKDPKDHKESKDTFRKKVSTLCFGDGPGSTAYKTTIVNQIVKLMDANEYNCSLLQLGTGSLKGKKLVAIISSLSTNVATNVVEIDSRRNPKFDKFKAGTGLSAITKTRRAINCVNLLRVEFTDNANAPESASTPRLFAAAAAAAGPMDEKTTAAPFFGTPPPYTS